MEKHSIKRSMAIIMACTIIVSALNFMTVSAVSTDVLREANFDTILKASITPTSISGYSTDLKNNGDATTPLNLVSLAPNPVTNDSADKTLKLTSGVGNPGAVFKIDGAGVYANTFPDGNVNVLEFSVLRNDHRATQAFEIFDSAYKKIYPIQIDATGKIQMKNNAGTFVTKTDTALALNTWHTFTFVFDMTAATKYLTIYVNGTLIDKLTLDPAVTAVVSSGYDLTKIFGLWVSTSKSGPTVNTYFNDVRFYTAKAAASVNIASPKSGDKYLYGSTLKLDAKTFIGTNSKLVKKVEFYVNNKIVGEKTSAPYTINYKPLYSGSYELTAKMYDEDNTVINSTPVTFSVSPSIYKETEVVKHDFNTYAGGTPAANIGESWVQSTLNGALVDGYYTANQVDLQHGKSIVMKSGVDIANTELFMNLPWNKKPTGAFHLTGEFLYNDIRHQRLNLIIQQNADSGTGRVKAECIPFDFASTGIVQSFGGATRYMDAYVDDRWYKIDIIGEVSGGILTINGYIDGKLFASDLKIPNWVQMDRVYLTKQGQGAASDGYVTVDNVGLYSLDTRNTIESFGIYKGTTSITGMSQLAGGDTITLKADIAPYLDGDNKYSLVLVTYNNGVIDNVVIKDFNSIDKFEASITLPSVIDNYNVKGFLWNGMGDIKPLAEGIDLNTTP